MLRLVASIGCSTPVCSLLHMFTLTSKRSEGRRLGSYLPSSLYLE